MYQKEFTSVANAARNKVSLLRENFKGYFLSSVLAGIFIGFGVTLSFSIGGWLNGEAYAKVIMGLSFGVALSLVVIAGAELFTGNNFVMMAGILKERISWLEAIKLWGVCYIGNWLGSILLAVLFWGTGLSEGQIGEFIAQSSVAKMSVDVIPLFIRGILCNMLVCLAIWSTFRCKSESGKLIMILWCIFAFFTVGFEHSVANMSILTMGLLAPYQEVISIGGYFYNLIVVTLGNMVGGIVFTAIPYFVISKEGKETLKKKAV